jgi:hypothetical protein
MIVFKTGTFTNSLLTINAVFKQRKDRPREYTVMVLPLLLLPTAFTTKHEQVTPTEADTLQPLTAPTLCLLIGTTYFRIRFRRQQHNKR